MTESAVKSALSALVKGQTGWSLFTEASREYVGVAMARNAQVEVKIWITTPFELTQSNHLVWVRVKELEGEGRIGIGFKVANTYSIDDVGNIIKAAQKNLTVLAVGEVYTLKGNPPPRFAKKAPAEGAAPAADGADSAAAAPEGEPAQPAGEA
jgi:hypothetical protein